MLMKGFICIVTWVVASGVALAEDNPCNTPGHLAEVQCFGDTVRAATAELDKLYKSVLAQRPEMDPTDSRKGRDQLVKAQEAWRKYVKEQCDFVGGLQGGSNLWVTDFAAKCVLEETKKRIEFFQHMPTRG